MRPLTNTERGCLGKTLDDLEQVELDELESQDPGWRERIEDRKRKCALGQLKVEKEVADLAELDKQIEALERKKKDIERRIYEKMPLEKPDSRSRHSCPSRKDLCDAISGIGTTIHHREMKRDAAGKKALSIAENYRWRRARLATCSSREDVAEKQVIPV